MIFDEALNDILVDMKNQTRLWRKKYNSLNTKHGKLLLQLTVDLNAAIFIIYGQHELTPQGIKWAIEGIFPTFNVVRIQNTLGPLKYVQSSDLQRYISNVKCIINTLQTRYKFLDNLLF